MARNGAFPRRWLDRGIWTVGTLSAMTWFRVVSAAFSFMEDPFLQGMLAVSTSKGRSSRVRAAMVTEAEMEAAKETDRLQAAGRLTYLESRPPPLGRVTSCGGLGEGQGRGPEGEDPAGDGGAERREACGRLDGPGLQRFYDDLLEPFVATYAYYLEQLAFAIGGPRSLRPPARQLGQSGWTLACPRTRVPSRPSWCHGPKVPGDAPSSRPC